MTTLEQLQQRILDLSKPYRSSAGVNTGVNIACDLITEIRRIAGELPAVPNPEIAKLQAQIHSLDNLLNVQAEILQMVKDALELGDDKTMAQLPEHAAGVMRELAHYKDEMSKVAGLKIELAHVKQELALLQSQGRNSTPPF